MAILEKVRNLPEGKRKMIFWSILIVIGLGSLFIYFVSIQNNIKNFKLMDLKGGLKMPNFGEELKDLPKLEMPQINEEENQTSTSEEEQSTTTE